MRGKLLIYVISWVLLGRIAAFGQLPEEYSRVLPREIKDRLAFLSSGAMTIVSQKLGLKEIAGKPLPKEIRAAGPPTHARAIASDVPVSADPNMWENEPSVAANPRSPSNVVAGMHFGSACAAVSSFDGGMTWSVPVRMPQKTLMSTCSDPVLAFAPDGSRVYYAYMDIFAVFDPNTYILILENDIVVSISDNGGVTWTGPSVALKAAQTKVQFVPPPAPGLPTPPPILISLGFDYDKPWISTSTDAGQSNWVYVSATRFDQFEPYQIHIAFAASRDKGGSWNAAKLLDSSTDANYPPPLIVVQGSRPAGGMGGNVLVAWYHSDGPPRDLLGVGENSFLIRTRYSSDHGSSFGPIVDAAVDTYETPYWLGPFESFYRWWGTSFPDVKIAADGSAHIVYTHDPVPGSVTAEDGDIRYISSRAPPYFAWTRPVTISDSSVPRAQGFASVEVREASPRAVYATFLDSRLSPISNLLYDVFGTKKPLVPGGSWLPNFRISAQSSIAQYTFIGDYFDLTVSGDLVYQVWTDRRNELENFIGLRMMDVFGSRIIR